ncbi:S8 family peptidase [Exiguobacterium alkaliphilum]|uniref:Peptidase S8 n=1 Tax=Exiguobacterium alkaliphilum TaxID=1428684 RepID=A0ABT2KWL8_9BACL|nr:S8 family peptidase [Exiguobacterium alkaliphilum]MCT4794803.1 peptidase S8 [Exiguobacterium alkaliphilum]
MKQALQRLIAVLTALVLVASIVPPSTYADRGQGMNEAKLLTPGEAVEFTTGTDKVNTYWFKMERQVSSMTHMEVTLDASKLTNISVYPSADMAAKDETFERYRSSATQEEETRTAKIELPYAWEGPYYIKVEYMPMEMMDIPFEQTEGEEPTTPDMSAFASKIKLVYNPVKLPVNYEQVGGDMCAVESVFQPAPERDTMLKLIRRVQTEVLNGSAEGRDLSALYYRTSPYVVRTITFDKTKRQAAYADLKTLRPLMTALVDQKSYTLTNADAAAINRLHALVRSSVPAALQAEVDGIAGALGMSSLAGTPLVDLFGKVGMNIQSADTPRYIVKYKSSPNTSIGKMNAMQDVSAERLAIGAPGEHFALVDVEDASPKMQATAKSTLEKDTNVEYIEPVQTYQAFASDVNVDYQWAINESSVLKPFKGAGIGLDAYEGLKLPNRTIKVAVLDTGVDYRLLDLKGKVDIRNEKNFVDPNGEGDAIDDHGHGTHVAGVISATRDNGVSMRGIVPNVSILPVKVLDAGGSGETDQIALGIKYAVDAGAKVINMSLGGGESRTMGYMLKYAYDRGVIVVAATGNDGQSRVSYPASSKYTISVGATNTFGIVSDYSNYGLNVDVVAPGSKVASLVPDGNVVYMDGTSMATPHVAAVAALLKSHHPSLTVEQMRTLLQRTADPINFSGGDAPYDPRVGDGFEFVLEMTDKLPPRYYDVTSGYGKANVFRAESMLRINPSQASAQDNAAVFRVKAKSGTVVKVYSGEKLLGKGTAKQSVAAFKVAPQKAGSVLRVVYENGKHVTGERILVASGKRPVQPTVTRPRTGATKVTGRGDAGMTVIVRNSKLQLLGKATINVDGSFTVKTRALKKGEKVSVHIEDTRKRAGKMTHVTVQ